MAKATARGQQNKEEEEEEDILTFLDGSEDNQ